VLFGRELSETQNALKAEYPWQRRPEPAEKRTAAQCPRLLLGARLI